MNVSFNNIGNRFDFCGNKKLTHSIGDLNILVTNGSPLKGTKELKTAVDNLFKEYSGASSFKDTITYKELINLTKDELKNLYVALYEAVAKDSDNVPELSLPSRLIALSNHKDAIELHMEKLNNLRETKLDKEFMAKDILVLMFSIGYEDKLSHPTEQTMPLGVNYVNSKHLTILHVADEDLGLTEDEIVGSKKDVIKIAKFLGYTNESIKGNTRFEKFRLEYLEDYRDAYYRNYDSEERFDKVAVGLVNSKLDARAFIHEFGHHIFETMIKEDVVMEKEFNIIWDFYKFDTDYNQQKSFNIFADSKFENYYHGEIFDDSNYENISDDAGHIEDGATEMFASACQAIVTDYYMSSDNGVDVNGNVIPIKSELYFKAALESPDTPETMKKLGYTMLAFFKGHNIIPDMDENLIPIDEKYVLPELKKYL